MLPVWRKKADPAQVEQKCVDCPRTFQRSAYATKQVRCDVCQPVRVKALAKKWNDHFNAKRSLTRAEKRVQSATAVHTNREDER